MQGCTHAVRASGLQRSAALNLGCQAATSASCPACRQVRLRQGRGRAGKRSLTIEHNLRSLACGGWGASASPLLQQYSVPSDAEVLS